MPNKLKLHSFVFLGAFLLFTMEPMVARMILPLYGGAFHVWSTTLTFFQGILFFGYVYCHIFAKRLGGLHLALVASPLIWLPLVNQIGITPPDDGSPVWPLIFQLTLHVALPFGILATTSVMAQHWFTRSDTRGRSPYILYASSNAGSLLALLSYIALCEPLLGLKAQSRLWYVGYIIYAILAWRCWRMTASTPKNLTTALPASNIDVKTIISWLLLSALPSAFMLATSNAIALELGSIPLVWVLPLTIYLLTYVLSFSQRQWIPSTLLNAFWPAALIFGLCSHYSLSLGSAWELLAHLIALFALAMVGHGELHRLRPSSDQLTVFYLAIALGGWLGSASVSFLAPVLFNSLAEYPIIIGFFATTILIIKKEDLVCFLRSHLIYSCTGIVLAVSVPFLVGIKRIIREEHKIINQYRNYYGIYKVTDRPLNPQESQDFERLFSDKPEIDSPPLSKAPILRTLMHGSTIHGFQIMHPFAQKYMTSYYHSNGPLKGIFSATLERSHNAAIIGLGVGTCAAYFNEKDSLTFYELDPAIVDIAKKHYTYLGDCEADLKIVTGDARINLENAPNNFYDTIMVDAFSSDAIPTHLLTQEALSLYEKKLAPNGTVVFHISNRHYEIGSVLKSTSAEKWQAFGYMTRDLKPFQDFAIFCSLRRKGDNTSDLQAADWRSMEGYPYESAPWSDDYINTLSPLYYKYRN